MVQFQAAYTVTANIAGLEVLDLLAAATKLRIAHYTISVWVLTVCHHVLRVLQTNYQYIFSLIL